MRRTRPAAVERVQRLVDRLQGHVAHPGPHPGRDPVDAEVVPVPDGLEQRDADGRHPQAGTAQFIGGGRDVGRRVHRPNLSR